MIKKITFTALISLLCINGRQRQETKIEYLQLDSVPKKSLRQKIRDGFVHTILKIIRIKDAPPALYTLHYYAGKGNLKGVKKVVTESPQEIFTPSSQNKLPLEVAKKRKVKAFLAQNMINHLEPEFRKDPTILTKPLNDQGLNYLQVLVACSPKRERRIALKKFQEPKTDMLY